MFNQKLAIRSIQEFARSCSVKRNLISTTSTSTHLVNKIDSVNTNLIGRLFRIGKHTRSTKGNSYFHHNKLFNLIIDRNIVINMTKEEGEENKVKAQVAVKPEPDTSKSGEEPGEKSNQSDNNNSNNNNRLDGNNEKDQNKKRKRKRKPNRWGWTKKLKNKKNKDSTNGGAEDGGSDGGDGDGDGDGDEGTQKTNQDNKKKNIRKNLTWTDNPKEVNVGSFACKEMQDLFNVYVDIPVPTNESATATSEDKVDEAKENEETIENENKNAADEVKLPKRKVALFIAFLGTKYMGMQMNKDQRTIQAEIELALYKAKMIGPTNFGYPNKYSWSSSARTDKGVHSCAQVCSAKILLPTDDLEKVRDLINEHLPDDIVILDVKRAARSFVAKTSRDKVRYQYMLPSFMLQDHESMQELLLGTAQSKNDNKRLKDWNEVTEEEIQTLREKFQQYRVPEDKLQKLEETLNRFAGTHKFHNYTSRKDAQDDSSRRYILSFKVLDKKIDKHGIEWISTVVVGQSFLLHQIRKMTSMTIDVTRGAVPQSYDTMEESFSDKYMSINVAPAQGLFLEMSFFDNYNKRARGKGEDLDWSSNPESAGTLRWKNFKEEKVMQHIMEEEHNQNNFMKYLFMQELHLKHVNYEATDEKTHTTYYNPNRK